MDLASSVITIQDVLKALREADGIRGCAAAGRSEGGSEVYSAQDRGKLYWKLYDPPGSDS